jgi:hypothetical protein
MYFQLRYITAGFNFGKAQVKIPDDVKKMSFLLRERLPEDTPPPIEPGDGVVTVICQRDVPDAVSADATSGKPVTTSVKEVLDAYSDMREHMTRMLRLARWRANYFKGGLNPLRIFMGLEWSFDGVEWKPVRRIATSARLYISPQPTPWTVEAQEFMGKESSSELDEPLGHELLREAWTNRGQNPRSSVVLAVAAAEVGFKQFASKSLPETAWILESLQSPPLISMLTKFPWSELGLQLNNKVPMVPKSIIKELGSAVSLRNKIVHTGVAELKDTTVESVITAVRDLLYFLDALEGRGQSWPINNMSHEARKEFD